MPWEDGIVIFVDRGHDVLLQRSHGGYSLDEVRVWDEFREEVLNIFDRLDKLLDEDCDHDWWKRKRDEKKVKKEIYFTSKKKKNFKIVINYSKDENPIHKLRAMFIGLFSLVVISKDVEEILRNFELELYTND